MNIYFAGSIRGGRDDQEIYFGVINLLSQFGTVLTEHVGEKNLGSIGEKDKTDEFIYLRDMDWVKQADVLVAEVTNPSLGVGYEIGRAEGWGKPILCLYRQMEGKRLSAMINGNKNVLVKTYASMEDIPNILQDFFTLCSPSVKTKNS